MVSDYTGLSFLQLEDIYYDVYLLYLKDAFIYRMESTEKGLEYLKNAHRIKLTQPDREKIRERMEKR